MFLLFMVVVSDRLLRSARGDRTARSQPRNRVDEERRTFLARLTAGGDRASASPAWRRSPCARRSGRSTCAGCASGSTGCRARSDGFRIVQLTDIHVGADHRSRVRGGDRRSDERARSGPRRHHRGSRRRHASSELRDAVAPLANLRARHGVFFVTGNHEYFSDAPGWTNELSRLGIRVLAQRTGHDWRTGPSVSIWPGSTIAPPSDYGGLSPDAALGPRARGPRPGARAGPARPSAAVAARRRAVRDRAAALRSHPRRPDLAVRLRRPPAATVPRRASPPRQRPDLREPGHRLLGAADAPRRAGRDHRDSAGERLESRRRSADPLRGRAVARVRAAVASDDRKVGDRQRNGRGRRPRGRSRRRSVPRPPARRRARPDRRGVGSRGC